MTELGRRILSQCNLIDGIQAEPLQKALVVIEGGTISWAGRQCDWGDARQDDEVIDMKGMFILPGLWDMHIHLDYKGIDELLAASTDSSTNTLFAYRRALTFLNAGVTSLRVVGTKGGLDFALRSGIESGTFIGPRIVTAGEAVASTGGHGSPQGRGCDGPYEFRRAARQALWQGADLVKVMVTGGIAGMHEAFDAPQTLRDEVAAAVEVAHNWGKHVSGHIASTQAAIMCSEIGLDTVEHGYALDEEAIKVMAANGTAYIPTLVVTDNPSYWEGIGTPGWAVDKIRKAYNLHHRAVELAIEAGIKLGVGTDVPTAFMDGTLVTIREMEALARLGASPREVIRWATRVPAEICGFADELGTIETGKSADLIAVPDNPYDSVSHLRDVRFVMARGSIVKSSLVGGPQVGLLAGFLEGSS